PHAARQVGACVRLGERQRAQNFAARQGREILGLLLLRAPLDNRSAAQAVVRGNGQRRAAAGASDLLQGDDGCDAVQPSAAVLFRHLQAQQPEPGHLPDRIPAQFLLLVYLGGVRRKLPGGKIPHCSLKQPLLLRQRKIHRVSSHVELKLRQQEGENRSFHYSS